MPWSNDVLTRTVIGTYLSANGNPANGRISFRPTARILDENDTILLNTVGMIIELDVNGSFSIELPTTDNSLLKPAGWAYEVVVRIYGSKQTKFYMFLPYDDGSPVNIVNVISAGTTETPISFYGTQTPVAGIAGIQGPTGPQGPAGATGPAGSGMPAGGAIGDLLAKTGSGDYATGWTDSPTVDSLNFDLVNSDPVTVGRMTWNDTDGSLDLGLKGGNVTIQVGQEQVQRVVNRTGTIITRGQVVRLFGSSGQRIGVALAQATTDANSSKTYGVAAEDIADNQTGFVMTEGFVRNINTSALTEGAIIWLSPTVAGGMTTTKTTAPNHLVMVGVCVVQANNGIIAVKVQNGYEVDELHDVAYTNLATGDLLTRTSSALWENITRTTLASDSAFSSVYAPLTRTVGNSLATTGTVNLDATALNGTYQTISLTGGVTFTTTNRAAGKVITIKLSAGAAIRALAFPAWTFVGSATPTSIAANKTAIITITFFDATDAGAVAAYVVQP